MIDLTNLDSSPQKLMTFVAENRGSPTIIITLNKEFNYIFVGG